MTQPTIEQAKTIAYANRASGTLILSVGGGQFGLSSYGMTRAKCDAMKRVLMQIDRLIGDGMIDIPAELRK